MVKASESSSEGGDSLQADDPFSGTDLDGSFGEDGRSDQEELEEEHGEAEEGAELHAYARSLGLDPDLDADLLWVAQEAFAAPLPAGWTDHVDAEGRVYFCNTVTQQSSWLHPTDIVFRELLDLIKALRSEQPPAPVARRNAALRDHMVLAHRDAQSQLQGWSGPYESEQGPYYYNTVLDVSTWDNPVDERERELATRQRVLRRCLLLEWPSSRLAEPGAAGEAPAAPPPLRRPSEGSTLGLAAPCPGAATPKSPSSARSFYTAYSARSTRSGRSLTPASCASPLPNRSTPVSTSNAAAAADMPFAPPPRKQPTSQLRSLLKRDVNRNGGPDGEPSVQPLARTPTRSPVRSPVRTPARSPARSHARSHARSPARALAKSCEPSSTALPARAPDGSPVQLQSQPPAASQVELASSSEVFAEGPSDVSASQREGVAKAAGRGPRERSSAAKAAEGSSGNAGTVVSKRSTLEFDLAIAISAFAEDVSRVSLELPLGLSAEQRKQAKALAAQHPGLKCESFGFGAERRMHVFRGSTGPKDRQVQCSADGGGAVECVEFTFGPTDNLELPKFGT